MRQYLDDHKAFHSFSEFLWPQQKTCKRVPFFTNYDLHHSTRPCGHAARRPVWPNGQAFKCFGTKPVSCSRHISAASLLATTLSSAMWHFARANNWALLLLSKVLASQNTRPPRVSTLVTAWNAQNGWDTMAWYGEISGKPVGLLVFFIVQEVRQLSFQVFKWSISGKIVGLSQASKIRRHRTFAFSPLPSGLSTQLTTCSGVFWSNCCFSSVVSQMTECRNSLFIGTGLFRTTNW